MKKEYSFPLLCIAGTTLVIIMPKDRLVSCFNRDDIFIKIVFHSSSSIPLPEAESEESSESFS
jgi:hypothetical protein